MKATDRITEQFFTFHKANRHIYDILVRYARALRQSGMTQYSIKGLFEVLRYDMSVSTDGKRYKLSNNLTRPYARFIMEKEKDLQGFFRTKQLKAEAA